MEQLGISHLQKQSFRDLSGGQKQRVLLARALCATKQLLVLDEPTAGLDPLVTRELYELITTINQDLGLTILMVSHDLQSVVHSAENRSGHPEAFAELTATHAARLYGLYPKKGVLKEGSDADLVVYDPEGERILTKEEQIEAVDYTPYEGQTIQGSVRDVWLRGQRAIRNGNRVETPHGQYVFARKETEGGISA